MKVSDIEVVRKALIGSWAHLAHGRCAYERDLSRDIEKAEAILDAFLSESPPCRRCAIDLSNGPDGLCSMCREKTLKAVAAIQKTCADAMAAADDAVDKCKALLAHELEGATS